MPNITITQREEIIRTLNVSRAKIVQAGATHLGPEDHINFEPARAGIEAALQSFVSVEYPREATSAARHLETARGVLQEFIDGVAGSDLRGAEANRKSQKAALRLIRIGHAKILIGDS